MSDIARFTAAVLRDKAMSDLLEEVKTLREEKHALEYVEITGPNRQPVYAQGHLREDGAPCSLHPSIAWTVTMKQVTPCPLQDTGSIELWVKGCNMVNATTSTDRSHNWIWPLTGGTLGFSPFCWTVRIKVPWTEEVNANRDRTVWGVRTFFDFLNEEKHRLYQEKPVEFTSVHLDRDDFSLNE